MGGADEGRRIGFGLSGRATRRRVEITRAGAVRFRDRGPTSRSLRGRASPRTQPRALPDGRSPLDRPGPTWLISSASTRACGTTLVGGIGAFACPECGDLIDVVYDWDRLPLPRHALRVRAATRRRLDPLNFSGVWRFRELLPFSPPDQIVTIGEGQTLLQRRQGRPVRGDGPGGLRLQYEGMNPSGKLQGQRDDCRIHPCPDGRCPTGRLRQHGQHLAPRWPCIAPPRFRLQGDHLIGSGKIAYGKLAQALDHGALTIQIVGDFDDAMHRVKQVADRLGIYLMNSVNPFRLKGQKTIMYRVLEALGWEPPDWIIVPGGNLGNSKRLRQGVHRAEAPRPDRPRSPTGGDQRRGSPDARPALRQPGSAGTTACPK